MFAEDGVVFPEGNLVRGVHGVFLGVIGTDAGAFGDEAY